MMMRWQRQALGASVAAALLLVACGGGDPVAPQVTTTTTPTATASPPVTPAPPPASVMTTTATVTRTATAAPSDVRRATGLAQALKETPWQADELPVGWSQARAREANRALFSNPVEPAGIVSFEGGTTRPEESVYLVFATEGEARAFYVAGYLGNFRSLRTFNDVDLASPNTCYEGYTLGGDRVFGTTYCTVYAGNVVVLGSSIVPSSSRGGDNTRAALVARAALAHLGRVQGR